MYVKNPVRTYHRQNSIVWSCQYHLIFCPKYRRPVLIGAIKDALEQFLIQKQDEYGFHLIEYEIMSDHVHLLIEIPPTVGIYSVVSKIKGGSSRALRDMFTELKSRLPSLWTRSYFVASVGTVTLETVKKYIEEQRGK